jgi:hypothetical protein
MRILIQCSKRFYGRIPDIEKSLKSMGIEVILPNSYDDLTMELKMMEKGEAAHRAWKSKMFAQSREKIGKCDAILVLNYKKDDTDNYIGGGTFLEIYEAFMQHKMIFLMNPINEGAFYDELISMIDPTCILHENITCMYELLEIF